MKLLFFLFMLFSISSCSDCFSDYRNFKKQQIYSVIINANLDSDNHMTPLFILGKEKRKLWLIGLTEMCNNANPGDTLRKDSNSLNFYLIKKDTTLFFNPKCNGKFVY